MKRTNNPNPVQVASSVIFCFFIIYASSELRVRGDRHPCEIPADIWHDYQYMGVAYRVVIEAIFWAYCFCMYVFAYGSFFLEISSGFGYLEWSVVFGASTIVSLTLYYRRRDAWVQWLFTPMPDGKITKLLDDLVIKID